MGILHTADWHLGRYLYGTSLLDDQAHVLDQFVDLARSERVDAVVIAGDVYDRAVPPAEAVALLDDVLSRLVVGAGIPFIVIAGNHDSAERIGFGGRIFERQKLILRGALDKHDPVILSDQHGEVAFHALPYAEPAFVRALPGAEAVTDHQSAMSQMVRLLRARRAAPSGAAQRAGGGSDLPREVVEALEADDDLEIAQGGAATTAYATLQFEDLAPQERRSTKAALLRYCATANWTHWRWRSALRLGERCERRAETAINRSV